MNHDWIQEAATSKDLRELLREYGKAVVELAIVRHDLSSDGDEMDIFKIAEDAVNAAEGIDTCDEDPIPEYAAILRALSQTSDANKESK